MPDPTIPASPCTACGEILDRASCCSEDPVEMPTPGDITICAGCGHVMVFDDKLRLRDPTNKELYEIAGDKEVLMAQRALAEMKKQRTLAEMKKKQQ